MKIQHKATLGARAGVTLIEIMITLTVGLTVMGAVTLTTSTNARALQNGGVISGLQSRSSRVVDRVARELVLADLDSLAGFPVGPAFSLGVTYDVPINVAMATGVVTWQTNRIELRYDPAEANDGVDNDGDGLIDEGRIVLIRDFGGAAPTEVVLCHGVAEFLAREVPDGNDNNGNLLIDERGLCLEFDGENMIIRVTLESLQSAGNLNQHTVETTVGMRN